MVEPILTNFNFIKSEEHSENKSSYDISKEPTPTSNIVTDFTNEAGGDFVKRGKSNDFI